MGARFGSTSPAATIGTGKAAKDGDTEMTLGGLSLDAGEYVIRWTSVADDGDLLRGTIRFTVLAALAHPGADAHARGDAHASRDALVHGRVRRTLSNAGTAAPSERDVARRLGRRPRPQPAGSSGQRRPPADPRRARARRGRRSVGPAPQPRRVTGDALPPAARVPGLPASSRRRPPPSALPAVASAHGLSATYQSPLPLAVYLVGAATTVGLSFLFVLARDMRAVPTDAGHVVAVPALDPARAARDRAARLGLDHGPGDRRRVLRRRRRAAVPVDLRLGRRRPHLGAAVPGLGVARPVRDAPRHRAPGCCARSASTAGRRRRSRTRSGSGRPRPGSCSSSGSSSSRSPASRR